MASNDTYLREITTLQTKVINKYRLTNGFKKSYGNYIINKYPNGSTIKWAIDNINKYKHIDNASISRNRKTIIDLLYACKVLGFLPWEFFSYKLEGKSIKQCLKFIPQNQVVKMYNYINVNIDQNHLLGRKDATYNLFKDLYKREIITISDQKDFKTFTNFCEKNSKFIVKPYNQACGKGIYIQSINKKTKLDKVFNNIISNGTCLCEELIINHHKIREIHPSSVNTCRVITYYNGKKAKVVCAWFRCGMGNSAIDNGSAGGLACAIDITSGKLYTDAASENNNNYKTHPDTGVKFKGFQIPCWDELLELAKIAAKRLPEVPLIGWDFALSENKGWQIIEGNEKSQTNIIQMATKKGIKSYLLKEVEYNKLYRLNRNKSA